MSLKKDVIGADVQINSNEAQKSLVDLSQKTSELANENDRLRISQAKLKALGKEHKEEYDKVTKAISENSKQIKENNAQMDALRKTIGITEMSTKQLSKRALELRRELSGMSQASDPERFNKLNKELIDTERQMRKNKAAIGETKEAVSPLIETAKGLLPAFGWAAIGAGAVAALNKIKDSTDTLATQWEVFMGGMNQATDEFFRTIATGDWSNFIGRMREAIEVGREYQETLDDLEEKSRALRIAEAESRAKELDLEIKLRNKTLSNEERRKAGEERIQIEKDMADKRTKLAQEAFDAEFKKTMQESKLSEEQLKKVMRDFDSMDKEQAKIYLGMIDNRKKLQETMLMEGSTDYDLDKMKRLNAEIDAAPESIKLYAQAVAGQGRTTDEQLNKTTDAWVNLLGAQNSAVENIPRIITQVNTLLASEDEFGQKLEDKVAAARKKASNAELETLDAAQNQILAQLTNQYEQRGWTDERFKVQQLIAEQAYLEEKRKILRKYGQSTVDIDKQINQKRIENQRAFNDLSAQNDKDFIKSFDDSISGEEKEIADSITETGNSINESVKIINDAKDKEQKILEARAQMYQQLSETIVSSISSMLDGSLDEYATYGDALILMALQVLKQLTPIWSAQIVAGSLATPDSIMTGGISGIAKFTAMLAIMNGAIAIAENAVQTKIENKRKAAEESSKGYASGGYAYEKQYWVGEEGPEFIASNPAVRNKTVKPVLDIIKLAQDQGTIATLNLPAVMASMGAFTSGSRQSGGFANPTLAQSPYPESTAVEWRDPELTAALNNMSRAVGLLMKNGVQFPIVPFKKDLDEISDLLNQTGMGGFKK